MVYVQANGTEVSLGTADYTHHTTGDEGMYVTNAWPGIDIEMNVLRAAIKTNFHINHAMPQYATGKLLIRDHLSLDPGLTIATEGKTEFNGELMIKNNAGDTKYAIGAANVYEQGNYKNTVEPLYYHIGTNNVVDIALPGNYLNKPELSYPIIIDPLVSTATSTTINGSTYLTTLTATGACHYVNAANTPINCTITDIQFAFQYTAVAPNWIEYAGSWFYLGTCRSPGTLAFGNVWTCGPPAGAAPGTCTATGGTTYSIWGTAGAGTSGLGPCVPAPSCPSYSLNIDFYFYQSYAPAAACATTYAYGSQPLVITVIGHTVEFVSATPSPATICLGASTTLTGAGTYGVPPYTFTWTPGPVVGSPATVTPGATTTYNLTITDACGITATGSTVVTVNSDAPITGTLSLCVGNTITLGDATAGAHSWTSSNTGVATITSPGGVVSAVGTGTTTITFTSTATGCTTTAVVTVTPLPTAILGTLTLCVGSTTPLTDATAGGAWSSSNTAVATITAAGVVSGIATGTSMITYGSATCYATAIVTVNLLAPITGTLTVCQGGTTTLADAAGGGTWTSSNLPVATVGLSTGIVSGVSGGTTTITYTAPSGCTTTAVVTVNPLTPITGTTPICLGSTTTLTDASGGGTWTSTNTGVATIGLNTGLVTSVTTGTTLISYVLPSGCYTSMVFTVVTVAGITGNLPVCVGATTTLNDATAGGTWNSGTTGVATIGLGTGVLTGVSSGTSIITYTSTVGCTTTVIATVNPLPAAITGITNVCVGLTTALTDATAGGTWSSSNSGTATVNATGTVTGVAAGGVTITYKLPTGCIATIPVIVNPLPNPIAGPANVCMGSSITLTDALAGGTWLSGNTAAVTIGLSTGSAIGVAPGVSTITYTLPTGCLITTTITTKPLPNAPTTVPLDYCQNAIADTLTATPNNNLLWYPSATGGVGNPVGLPPSTATPGVYSVYVTQTVNGCESPRAQLLFTVHIHAVFSIVPARPTACQDDTISFQCSPTFAGETFSWGLPSNGVLSSGYSLNNQSIQITYDTSLGYNYVTLTVGDGYVPCDVTDSLPMLVYNNNPYVTFYIKPDVCVGDSVNIALTNIGPGVTDYVWNFNGANILASSSNHGGPFIVNWTTPGVYTVSVTAISNLSCPSKPILDTIDVHPYPDARIATPILLNSKNGLCLGDSVLLSVISYDPEDQYVWAPAHFFDQRDVNRVYGTIQKPGYVYLTVTDPFGCIATDSVLFSPQSCCQVYFPNAFTPNGDGNNDVFKPKTLGNHTVHQFRIVNRWGQTVFESANERDGLNGLFNGVPQDMDVYYFYYEYDCDGKKMYEKGEVNLIR